MVDRNGQSLLQVWVPAALAESFKGLARERDGSVSKALARLIAEAATDAAAITPRGTGQGKQIGVRFKADERALLAAAAADRRVTPANWLRSLALVHLARRPQWNPEQLEAIRQIAVALSPIGNNVNQIARAVNIAANEGEYASVDATIVQGAAETVRVEMRRLMAIMTADFDYWGDPHSDVAPGRGALKRQKTKEAAVARADQFKPRSRPKRFRNDA